MTSKASAPGKVILFGEHFVVYGVRAILCAIDKRITVTAEKISDEKISIKSIVGNVDLPKNKSLDEIEPPLKPFYYLAEKILRKHDQKSGMKITIDSEIPLGVGLGSSSACCVAAAAAISGVFEKMPINEVLQMAIEAEKTIFPNTSGADCTVCTFGGIMQYDKQNGHIRLGYEPNFHLVIANSKIEHSTKEVVGRVRQFKENNENEFSQMCKDESDLVDDVLVCLQNNDLKKMGSNIIKNQQYLESIGVSNDKLRTMIKVANESSFGSKITGAGGGGCIYALTDEGNRENTVNHLQKNDYECFSAKIDFKGLDTF